MYRLYRTTTGQSLIEYAVLVAAVALGVAAAANLVYNRFVASAQAIEESAIVF